MDISLGRGVARIDYDSMDSLSASTGDVIEIRGKRRTVAKCLPLYPSDEGKGIIRVDGLVRNNAGVAIGDTVVVRKIKAVPAEKVIVAPLETIPSIDERYLADALESVPLIKGDNVMVPYFGGRLTFQVIGVTPVADAILVTQKTVFQISEKGEVARGITNVAYEDIGGLKEEIPRVFCFIVLLVQVKVSLHLWQKSKTNSTSVRWSELLSKWTVEFKKGFRDIQKGKSTGPLYSFL